MEICNGAVVMMLMKMMWLNLPQLHLKKVLNLYTVRIKNYKEGVKMNNNLQVIDERIVLGKEFRIYGDFENPLFLARDVAEWIDYNSDSRGMYNVSEMLATIDNNEKVKITYSPSINNVHTGDGSKVTRFRPPVTQWFLTEDGLYEVLMQSRKPIAKAFKKEVKQILKTIRKHGMYATQDTIEAMLADPTTMIKTLQALQAEREAKELAQQQLQLQAPKVEVYDRIVEANNLLDIGEVAKMFEIGRNTLFRHLKEKRILMYNNTPYQKFITAGYFIVKIVNKNGFNYPKTYVTAKGIEFLSDKIVA